ncbi:uncharacterized protein KD926_004707 [Aspergillus affinis]|uniref:uncharacterized protein n=1 Tax=Aspergillus affinis TaxID=1070780 RepID=UPI0022FDFADB|nr:uncharacterized protein KD926_004707 [Aspergillus affinis]KAI9042917.1 hypothetical protein KD926_004707 [Aspergillus affinis]
MKYPCRESLQQLHLQIGNDCLLPVSSHLFDALLYEREHESLQSRILELCPPYLWHQGSHKLACPRPILVTGQHKEKLSRLHGALVTAITDIVERWWTDPNARFSAQQWIDKEHLPYRNQVGSWRPDFLVEDNTTDGEVAENFRITEINARFSFNGFMHQAYGQLGLKNLGVGENGVVPATKPADTLKGMLKLLRLDQPLHLLKGQEPGIDIHMVIDFLHRELGISPRLVSPADLRILPDPQSSSKFKLYCVVKNTSPLCDSALPLRITDDGMAIEEVHQIGLELHQHELFGMPTEMLRQISLRCFNDMRTILLVHDKRMLGIVKQEIPDLRRRGILTPVQARALENGIADTIIPGSTELKDLIRHSILDDRELKNEYLLKPIRGGKGAGIIFGDEMSPPKWIGTLARLCSPYPVSGATTYVVQRRVHARLYEVVLKPCGELNQYPLIGTYHSVHGQFLGFGIWRSSPQRICAVSNGGSWMCTVMKEC